jgi:uncharacterized C2H2 Zn-finger protein
MSEKNCNKTQKCLQKLLKNSALSQEKIGNLCQFKCSICGQIFATSSGFYYHSRSTGHGWKTNGQTLISKSLNKAIAHECLECSGLVLCDWQYLRNHMKYKHNMTLKQYCRRSGCSLKEKARNVFMSQFLKDRESEALVSQQEIGNMCKLLCHICKRTFQKFSCIKRHMSKVHDLSFSNEQIAHNFLKKITIHKCGLCSKPLLCEISILGAHFISAHQLKVEEYCKFTGSKNIYQPVLATNEGELLSKNKTYRIDSSKTTNKVGSFCTWKCLTCSKLFGCKGGLLAHTKKLHEEVTNVDLGVSLTKTVKHQCHFCSKLILADQYYLLKHYRDVHGSIGKGHYKRNFVSLNRWATPPCKKYQGGVEQNNVTSSKESPMQESGNPMENHRNHSNNCSMFQSGQKHENSNIEDGEHFERHEKIFLLKKCKIVLQRYDEPLVPSLSS